MSDRNPGLLQALSIHFQDCKHLYCAVHILHDFRNIVEDEKQFWKAVKVTTEAEFIDACDKVTKAPIVDEKGELTSWGKIIKQPKFWVRYAIAAELIIRFGIRINKWAETQNSAFENLRSRPMLNVLINAFRYTVEKVQKMCVIARRYEKDVQVSSAITTLAENVLHSNWMFAQGCEIIHPLSVPPKWTVKELGSVYVVIIGESGNVSCSCLRFYDEGIPCQHILHVLVYTSFRFNDRSLISSIYRRKIFLLKPFLAKKSVTRKTLISILLTQT